MEEKEYQKKLEKGEKQLNKIMIMLIVIMITLGLFVSMIPIMNKEEMPITQKIEYKEICGEPENQYKIEFYEVKEEILYCVYNNQQPMFIEKEINEEFKICNKTFQKEENEWVEKINNCIGE